MYHRTPYNDKNDSLKCLLNEEYNEKKLHHAMNKKSYSTI